MSRHAYKKTVEYPIAALGTDVDGNTILGKAPFAGKVDSVSVITPTAITGANTNTRKHSIINKGQSGAGTAEIAALQYNAGVSTVAFDEKALTLTATAADAEVAAGDVLVMVSTAPGTGIADPGGIVTVVYSRDVTES